MIFFKNEAESQRFGHDIYRWKVDKESSPEEEFKEIIQAKPDIVIANIDFHHLNILNTLMKQCPSYHAGVKVSYQYFISSIKDNIIDPRGKTMKACSAEDLKIVARMIKTLYSNFESHYTYNPLLQDSEKITDGYIDWVMKNDAEGGMTYLIWENNEPIAFFSGRINGTTVDCLLVGVMPKYHYQGMYKLISLHFLSQAALERTSEIKKCTGTTEVQHYPHLRQWHSVKGQRYVDAKIIVHFNLLLSKLKTVSEINPIHSSLMMKTALDFKLGDSLQIGPSYKELKHSFSWRCLVSGDNLSELNYERFKTI